MPTFTTNYSFYKPAEGDGQDNAQQWAEGMNGNLDEIDALLASHAAALALKMSNPMTAMGDMIVGGASGLPTRVALGNDGQVWAISQGMPGWVDPVVNEEAYVVSSNALSDDFGDSIIDSKWSIYTAGAVVSSESETIGELHINVSSLNATPAKMILGQAFTPAGDWSITAGISMSCIGLSGFDTGLGIFISSSAPGDAGSQVVLELGTVSQVLKVAIDNYTNWAYAAHRLETYGARPESILLKIAKINTNYVFSVNLNRVWMVVHTMATSLLSWSPNYIGLHMFSMYGQTTGRVRFFSVES